MLALARAMQILVAIALVLVFAFPSGSSPPGFAASQLRGGANLNFDQVMQGVYSPSAVRASSPQAVSSVFGDKSFMAGAPIFIFADRGSSVAKVSLDEALATFGRFHIYNAATRRGISIKPDPRHEGMVLRTEEFGDVGEYMQRVFATRARFGDYATMLAHGPPASKITRKYPWSKEGIKTPEWEQVWKAHALPHEPRFSRPDVFRGYLRGRLEANRHVRFEMHGTSMGLRALPNGQIEKAFRDAAGETTHFHP